MATLDERLAAADGRPTGFDYLRILLACSVVAFHSLSVSYGFAYSVPFLQMPVIHAACILVLPMFFSLSGFLVSGSLDRTRTLFGFLGLRFIRIYPALTVEVLLSAFILGPIFTVLPLADYFSHHTFYRYLVNVTGHISFDLPGVFETNPFPRTVNGQLWTVPYELYCYFALTALAFVRLARRPGTLLTATVALQICIAVRRAISDPDAFWYGRFPNHVAGSELVVAFLAGVLVYRFKDRLPFSRAHMLGSLALAFVLFSLPAGEYLGVFVAAYATVCLGVTNVKKVHLLRGADYSYGVYLYGWPIQQALVATGDWARHAVVNLVASLAIAFAIAGFSWHMIEKPALQLRGPLKRLEERWMRLWKRSPTVASSA